MSEIKSAMPTLSSNEGVWEGTYRYYDASGALIDEHHSKLICRFPDSGPYPYHQTNHYTWSDGRTEVRDFPATYKDGRVWWDNDLIKGWAAEVALDEKNRTTMLYWERKGEPGLYLYEMIQNSDDRRSRCRTWHWIRDGKLIQRTCIEEVKVSDSWQGL
jgi:hypothetical protein